EARPVRVPARVRAVVVGAAVVASVLGQVLPAQASVTIKGLCGPPATWSPKGVSVAKGAKVIWKAFGCTHTVSSYSSNWSKNTQIAPGQTTSRIFKVKGVFKF